MFFLFIVALVVVSYGLFFFYNKRRSANQLAYIKQYEFSPAIKNKLLKKYPHLDHEQAHLVFRALRDYFIFCHRANKRLVAMPSQVVDDAWHEFILFTRSYKSFCQKALGRFLHHTPTEAMHTPTLAQDGIKRAWRLACAKEHINPKTPNRLPLIFSIDSVLKIPNGFTYAINCKDKKSSYYGDGYCAGHIGCGGGCSGTSGAAGDDNSGGGFFEGMFDSSDGGCSSGCGGGCGGD